MMTLSIFDFFFSLLGYGWKLLAWFADLSLCIFSAVFEFGVKAVSAVFDLLLMPFTHGLEHLWNAAGALGGLLGWVMGLLLTACLLLGLMAVGKNAFRRFWRR